MSRTCAKCRLRGNVVVPLKGHKRNCRYLYCACQRCATLSAASKPDNQADVPNGGQPAIVKSSEDEMISFPTVNPTHVKKAPQLDQIEMLLNGVEHEEILQKASNKRSKAEIM